MTGTQAYVLSKGYTAKTVVGLGAIKGANATVKSVTPSADGTYNTVVFEWTGNDGTKQTKNMKVNNGVDGHGIDSVRIDSENQIYMTMDGVESMIGHLNLDDCGSDVTVTPIVETGTKLATINVDGVDFDIYAPVDDGGASAELTADLTATKTVGGVSVGNQFATGTSLETVIRRILAPALYPTFTNPSATLSATGAKLLEVGTTQETTFTVTFSRGSISPAYGTNGYRSGAATGYLLNGGTVQNTNTFTETIDGTTTAYKATVTYSAGEQPKDSEGSNYNSALAAGSVQSNQINFEFVNPLYANTSSIATIAKLALVSKATKQKDLVFPAQTVANPEVFDVPASWTVTAVQVKNDLSGAFEDASDQFTVTNTTHNDAAGNSVNYKRYTFNLGFDTGARTVRLKWS